MRVWGALLCLAAGIMIGAGVFTFRYAEGLSYFSEDPKACVNCHIMQDQYNSWVKSSHHKAASCNDCHVPHVFPDKYLVKAQNGWHHSKAFTLQDFDEPIRITEGNLKTLQKNCLDCHDMMVNDIIGHRGQDLKTLRCTECHRSVGHMSLD